MLSPDSLSLRTSQVPKAAGRPPSASPQRGPKSPGRSWRAARAAPAEDDSASPTAREAPAAGAKRPLPWKKTKAAETEAAAEEPVAAVTSAVSSPKTSAASPVVAAVASPVASPVTSPASPTVSGASPVELVPLAPLPSAEPEPPAPPAATVAAEALKAASPRAEETASEPEASRRQNRTGFF